MKKEPDWNKVMEATWGRALVHESGHALTAVLEGIHCDGIYYDKSAQKFSTLIGPLPPPDQMNKRHYRFLLASSAAEDAIYGDHDLSSAKSDRSHFQNPGAPPLEETLDEVRTTVNGKKRQIRRIVSKMKSAIRAAGYNMAKLPDVGVDGTTARYAVLLTKDELEKLCDANSAPG
jgi:hypothetical protein